MVGGITNAMQQIPMDSDTNKDLMHPMALELPGTNGKDIHTLWRLSISDYQDKLQD